MRTASAFALLCLALCLTATGAAQVVYVDLNAPGPEHDGASWDTAFLTIQEGVDAATPGGEVWVADGTYVENIVMGEGVAIYGGFLGAEEDGYETERDQRDWVKHIATIDGSQSGSCVVMAVDARVDGFTATNGSGTVGHHDYLAGGGFHCESLGETGAIVNNTITGNTAEVGGGICCRQSAPEVANNTISGNWASNIDGSGWGGGMFCWGIRSTPIVANNTFSDNFAAISGGGIFCQECSPTLTGNTIAGNLAYYGGGICLGLFSPVVTNNTITCNSAAVGGGIYCGKYSFPSVTNNAIAHNSADICGGGIFCDECSPMITNCTIVANSAGSGAGLACDWGSSEVEIANCILWNGGDEIWNDDGSTIRVIYADVWGGWLGEGNIDADPLFVDPENGDFHLLPESPCIDAGCNDYVFTDEDIDGDPRIIWAMKFPVPYWPHPGYVDIGADEFVPRARLLGPAPRKPGDGKELRER